MTDDEKAIERANSVAEWLRKYWLPSNADDIDAVLAIARRAIAKPEPACVMCGGKPIETGTAGCKTCNQYAEDSLRPVESPDDWVTQNSVPSRPGIDEWRFVHRDSTETKWFAAQRGFCRKHDEMIDGHRYEVRCRRKDLPKKTHQVPVRLWREKESGQVVGTMPEDLDCVGDFAEEIKIGPDGKVFIEVSE